MDLIVINILTRSVREEILLSVLHSLILDVVPILRVDEAPPAVEREEAEYFLPPLGDELDGLEGSFEQIPELQQRNIVRLKHGPYAYTACDVLRYVSPYPLKAGLGGDHLFQLQVALIEHPS